jgi:hypothetical protein
MLVALLVGALLLLLGMLALFSYYPLFGMTLITACYVVWCYLFTENHLVHRAQVKHAKRDSSLPILSVL